MECSARRKCVYSLRRSVVWTRGRLPQRGTLARGKFILIRSAASSSGNHWLHLRLCYICTSNRSPHKHFCLIAWKEMQPLQCLFCQNFNDWNDDSTLTHIQTAVVASTPSSVLWDNQFILLSLLCVYWSVGMYVFWLHSTGLQCIVAWDARASKVIVSDVWK